MSNNKSLCDNCSYMFICKDSDVGISFANHLVCYKHVPIKNQEDCGKWIFHKDFNDSIKYGCNQCGNLTNIPSNFCPNCGKRMKKGAEI